MTDRNTIKERNTITDRKTIIVKNLSIGDIIKDVNFYVKEREILGIAGSSGSGKSMTCKALTGVIPKGIEKYSGRVFFSEKENSILEMHKYMGKHISMVFQEPSAVLHPLIKVGDQIGECLKVHWDYETELMSNVDNKAESKKECTNRSKKKSNDEIKSMVIYIMKEAGIDNPTKRYEQYPHELSGGMCQRIVIAIATILRPKLIVADEPTTALDVSTQIRILKLLKKINTNIGSSIIIVSHDEAVLRALCDRIIYMKDGKIVGEEIIDFKKYSGSRVEENDGEVALSRGEADNIDNKDLVVINKKNTTNGLNKSNKQNPILETKNLSVTYKSKGLEKKALSKIDFQIFKGEIVSVVGESGCGKSTLAKTIMGINKNYDGKIFLDGEVLRHDKKSIQESRQKVQMIFQDQYSSINPYMSVEKILEEPIKFLLNKKEKFSSIEENLQSRERNLENKENNLLNEDKKLSNKEKEMTNKNKEYGYNSRNEIIKYLKLVGLDEEFLNRKARTLSGGQRQRVGIARAMISRPEIIICDESVSALDKPIQETILDLLKELNENLGISIIFISHDLEVVKSISDRIYVMKNGVVCEEGTPTEIFNRPKDDYTKFLLSCSSVILI